MRSSPVFVGMVVLIAVLTACGDTDAPTSSAVLRAPDVVVGDWLTAVEEADAATLGALVTPGSLAFVIGVENRLDEAQIAALVDSGIPDELLESYWSSFGESFTAFGGRTLADLSVGAVRQFDASGARYAAVLVGDGEGTTEILVRRNVDGRWQVDLLATVGSGLVLQLRELARGAASDRFRTGFEQWVFPAIEAAAGADGSGELDDTLRAFRIALDAAGG